MGSEWKEVTLDEVSEMVTTRVEKDSISIEEYVSTENMLPKCGGIKKASNLPNQENVISFKTGDVLFSNIRTYFKKLWQANFDGGASGDVIIFQI